MKRKILWLVVNCLMVAALVLSSCAPSAQPTAPTTPTTPTAPTTPTTPTTPTPTPVPVPEVPKYGGTFIEAIATLHESFDDYGIAGTTGYTLKLTNEELLIGDWARGPAGTNEYDFSVSFYHPKFEVGCLAESWEIPDPETIIFHIRKGVHYGLNPKSEASRLVNGREMTAQDVAFCLQRKFSPKGYLGQTRPGWFQSATATDKWTVVVKAKEEKQQTPLMLEYLTDMMAIYPPEIIAKYGSMLDWSVSCGTGAFMMVDYVPGSSYTFVRNPDFWEKDPVGPGKGNQLPYLDQVKWLLILDKSTRTAALRTAKVDRLGSFNESLTLDDKESLFKTNPQLKLKRGLSLGWNLYGRMDKPELPFKDIRVRRALHMAIDFQKIKDEYYSGEAEIITMPVPPYVKDAYTPLEELPESTRELFSYNPKKAKELLAEAGYPKGFKTSIVCEDRAVDMLSIVKDYWAKIGVDLGLDVKERVVLRSIRSSRSHRELFCYDLTASSEVYRMIATDPTSPANSSMVDDPYCNDIRRQVWAFENMGNPAKIGQLAKEYALYCLAQAYYIVTPAPYSYWVWQPWVKNYHGENSVGSGNWHNYTKYIWLDQELKYKMAGRK